MKASFNFSKETVIRRSNFFLSRFEMIYNQQMVSIVLCLGLSAYFILDHLGLRAFWLDEASIANLITLPFLELPAQAVVDGCPVLYAVLLKIWAAAAGDSEFALRSFSAFFALLSTGMLFKAGKDIFQSEDSGITASFLAATNYFLIFFATQNKVYTLAAFAGLVSYYCFFRLAKNGGSKEVWAYSLSGAFSLYLHPWLFLVFAGQILAAFLFRKTCRRYRAVAAAQGVILILALPNIAITLYQGLLNANYWMDKPNLWTVLQGFKNLTFGSTWIYGGALAAALIFLWHGKRFPPAQDGFRKFTYVSLGLYLLFPMLAACAISQVARAYVPARYEMVVLPAFLLLAGNVFSPLKKIIPVALVVAGLLAAAAWNSVAGERRMVLGYRSSDQTVVESVFKRLSDGDSVVTTDLSYSTVSYYLRRLNAGEKRIDFELVAFPSEIKRHPSWKDVKRMGAHPELYRQEAEGLAKILKEKMGYKHTVWVFYKSGEPVNEALRRSLEAAFLFSREEVPDEPRQPSWFDRILTFRG